MSALPLTEVRRWVYQLQGYAGGGLAQLAAAPGELAVVDLARDSGAEWFTSAEIDEVRASGKIVLAYLEVGSLEDFRPEFPFVHGVLPELLLNRWDEWPDEHFVRYWEQRWWTEVLKGRIDRALRTGFDGIYLDTLCAYEEIDLDLVPGLDREQLAQGMVDLVVRIAAHARSRRPDVLVVPQNSPELARRRGFLGAIDALAMEELFVAATDTTPDPAWNHEDLAAARAVRDHGVPVLAVDYARRPEWVARAREAHLREGFASCIGPVALDRLPPTPPVRSTS